MGETTPSKGTKTAYNPDDNNTGKRGVEIQGEGNLVNPSAEFVQIQGDGNTVNGGTRDIVINGDNNTIEPGVRNVTLINTNNTTIEESDVTYIGGIKIFPIDVEQVSANQNVETDVKTYEVDTSGGDVTLDFNLATVTYTEGQVWHFKKTQTANKVIITATGGTIDGAANLTFKTKLSSFSLQFDGGTNFIII